MRPPGVQVLYKGHYYVSATPLWARRWGTEIVLTRLHPVEVSPAVAYWLTQQLPEGEYVLLYKGKQIDIRKLEELIQKYMPNVWEEITGGRGIPVEEATVSE